MIVETVRYVIYELHAGYTLILYTVSQRTVYVSRPRDSNETLGRLISSTAIPATLHSCREARNCRLYQRTFFEVDAQQGTTEQRYVWLNLGIDMVDVGKSEFRYFEHIASAIKRFKFERENTDEYF
jgi:hypothetical protein